MRGSIANRICLSIVVGVLCAGITVAVLKWGRRDKDGISVRERFFNAGYAAIDQDDFVNGKVLIQRLSELPDTDSDVAFLSGFRSLRIGDPERALTELGRVDIHGPRRNATTMLCGESLYRLGNLWDALRCFLRVAEDEPQNAEALRWSAAVYFDLGAMNHAAEVLKRLMTLRPDDFASHRLRGLIARDLEDHKTAIEEYRLALQLSPPPTAKLEISNELVQSLIAQHAREEALDVLNSMTPTGAVHVLKAECFLGLGDPAKAASELDLAHADCLNEPFYHLARARFYMQQGEFEEAKEHATTSFKLDPVNEETAYVLSQVSQRLRDTESAQKYLASFNQLKELKDSIVRLNREAILNPGDASVRDELAAVSTKLNRPKLAAMWKRAADACRSGTSIHPEK